MPGAYEGLGFPALAKSLGKQPSESTYPRKVTGFLKIEENQYGAIYPETNNFEEQLQDLKRSAKVMQEKLDEVKTAARLNNGKAQVSYMLFFPTVLEVMGRIMEFGATKYEDGNWKLGGKPDKEYLDSGLRHLLKWIEGETFDPDSGCNHLGHAIWNLCALLQLNYPDIVFDEELFRQQCKYWAKEKEKRNERTSVSTESER